MILCTSPTAQSSHSQERWLKSTHSEFCFVIFRMVISRNLALQFQPIKYAYQELKVIDSKIYFHNDFETS